ncbi:putative N-acetylmannosamine-6-phosphate 2-epimerase [Paenibacillus sp. LHD-117]|uniref:putative N-acetylmannosamine-6-phosphate 2-epimerase n=1 Tax=Paenibacillus sp. LHD-117 TaxID=3071412 RepID=UPI0027E206D3|nr:putative N-acetylmannosamine-6-phosphate 2-epimerase [Paenibacillus sp. LHD-117]MDQ6422422.1 putative N-acetylmannosamine-6-phosphate 2-epimerase [Paenibacillus sp. LHD-117]
MSRYSNLFPKRGLIVSCQALEHEPLHGGDAMDKMARAAVEAGAIAIRTNGVEDIKAIKEAVGVPIIGLVKREIPGSDVFITPTLDEVKAIIAAGADVVALDVTDREGRLEMAQPLIDYAHRHGVAVMADVSTYEEGLAAERLGADFVGTTLSGYTPYSKRQEEPDLELVRRLSESLRIPVVAEGRIWTPEQAASAMRAGATCVVVGGAITRPQLIAARYVRALDAFEAESPYAIGVDIGGTKINAGIVSLAGEVVLTHSLSTSGGKTDTAGRVMEAIDGLLSVAKARYPDIRCKGIGVGTAGQVDWREGSIRHASELIAGYTGTKLKALLEERYRLPVRVDNDVNALALTELRLGAGIGVGHFVCIALGTGVGGAVVTDGRLLRGAWGGAGELGHLSVDFRGEPCVCGARGCLEQYASGTGIARRMRERLAAAGRSSEQPDSREVIALWQAGEPLASAIMDEAISALGAAIASLIHTFNPELIVVGGGVADAGPPLLGRLREEALRRAMPSLSNGVRIEAAYRGSWSGMIGAALQLWE